MFGHGPTMDAIAVVLAACCLLYVIRNLPR